jgi:hypothetical protein
LPLSRSQLQQQLACQIQQQWMKMMSPCHPCTLMIHWVTGQHWPWQRLQQQQLWQALKKQQRQQLAAAETRLRPQRQARQQQELTRWQHQSQQQRQGVLRRRPAAASTWL